MANTNAPVDKNSLAYCTRQVNAARTTVLLLMVLTLANIVLFMVDTDTYLPFCVFVPYYLTAVFMGIDNGFADGEWVIGDFTIVALVITAVVLALYLLCWLLSKKKHGFLTAALVLYIVDTLGVLAVALVIVEDLSVFIFDFVAHGIVIYELVCGVTGAKKMKKLELEAQHPVETEGAWQQTEQDPWDKQDAEQ